MVVEKIIQNRKTKKIKKKKTIRRNNQKTWRQVSEVLIETVKSKMKISDVLDLSIMTKVIETGCQVRIQEHFNDSLEFQYLNTLEITVNGEKMTVFNVISFLEWITTFDLKWTTVSFINFPEDGILRRALFENVERVSKEVVLFQIHDENITISYRALASLCQICSSSPTPCELLHEMINLPPRAKNLKLEMCSADKAVIPRRFLKNLLNSINPTTLKVYFNSSTEILQMSEYCGDIFSLHDNPITHVSNGNLKFYNAYLNCLEDCCMMVNTYRIDNVVTSFFVTSVEKFVVF